MWMRLNKEKERNETEKEVRKRATTRTSLVWLATMVLKTSCLSLLYVFLKNNMRTIAGTVRLSEK